MYADEQAREATVKIVYSLDIDGKRIAEVGITEGDSSIPASSDASAELKCQRIPVMEADKLVREGAAWRIADKQVVTPFRVTGKPPKTRTDGFGRKAWAV